MNDAPKTTESALLTRSLESGVHKDDPGHLVEPAHVVDPDHVVVPRLRLDTTITVKNDHLPFLRAVFEQHGWCFEPAEEGITTDEGYDSEVAVQVRIDAPLDVIATASPARLGPSRLSVDLARTV